MPRFGQAYQDLCDVQQSLKTRILNSDDDKAAALCAREMREIEAYKRELRGKPRLKPVDMDTLLKRATTRPAQLAEPVEA